MEEALIRILEDYSYYGDDLSYPGYADDDFYNNALLDDLAQYYYSNDVMQEPQLDLRRFYDYYYNNMRNLEDEQDAQQQAVPSQSQQNSVQESE